MGHFTIIVAVLSLLSKKCNTSADYHDMTWFYFSCMPVYIDGSVEELTIVLKIPFCKVNNKKWVWFGKMGVVRQK